MNTVITNRRRLRRSFVLGAAVAALSTAFLATAATAQARVTLHLPAQPLGKALEALARQSGTDILFTPAAVAGMTAPALNGTMAPQAAVERLIAGTPLTVRREPNGALLVSGAVVGNAPQTVATEAPQNDTADIVVTGYASSLTTALAQKRKATNVIDVVKAMSAARSSS